MTRLAQQFVEMYDRQPEITQASPGRVNLLGEHIDYNGGMVLPFALEIGLTIALARRQDNKIRIASTKFPGVVEATLDTVYSNNWADQAIGVVIFANNAGLLSGGADILIESNMPDGAGLSSSASLGVGILKAARTLGNKDVSDAEIAKLARRVENEYIGVPCGIMDQMAVAVANPGQALALDTRTLGYETIDLPTSHHMAVIHSGIRRELSEGNYAKRKVECDEAKAYFKTDDLCHLADDQLADLGALPTNVQKRVRHCVSEHHRVEQAAKALKSGDLNAFGQLMVESHTSMRDDFEMSLPAIDALVEDAMRFGATGARLTGGGFGGCIVACVPKEQLESWTAELLVAHPKAAFIA